MRLVRGEKANFIGHNSRTLSSGSGSMYAIVFDLDTALLEELYPNDSWRNAYADIRNYLSDRGFEWMQGSTYFGSEDVDAVTCVTIIQKLSRKFDWFEGSVRDIRMLRIEENNDLMPALKLDDD